MIAAILPSKFNGGSITDSCAMGGITIKRFTNNIADTEIIGRDLEQGQHQGRQEGRLEGWQEARQQGQWKGAR